MLAELIIHNIVLIDELRLEMGPGLNVLTGETGAGKSILLDSLGLATGARADKGLIRHGCERGHVSAVFEVPATHPILPILADHDISVEDTGGPVSVILRRVQNDDGRSRAYINDAPVGIGLLRQIGERLLEVHGQHDERGLLDTSNHRKMLDGFGGLANTVSNVSVLYREMEEAQKALNDAVEGIADARAQVDYYTHVLKELEDLSPEKNEEDDLAARRSLMMHAEKIAEEVEKSLRNFSGNQGVDSRLSAALRRLEGVSERAGGKLDGAVEALSRALTEVDEARSALYQAQNEMSFDPHELERVEERLFGLRAGARKHNVRVDDLPALIVQFQKKLDDAALGEERLDALENALKASTDAYRKAAETLSKKRAKAAQGLDKAVAIELPPLKLEKATFHAEVERTEDMGPSGYDKVRFLISTNPGTPLGSLIAIASGGELARIVLALKVCLAAKGSAGSLIFDEVDQGIGGAVADAVGERLARLSKEAQVLVVTHSPQVAARGNSHWRIAKAFRKSNGKSNSTGAEVSTQVTSLEADARREEIARMLSGAKITDEARAAADQLIGIGLEANVVTGTGK
jgi:DNA repair protein RecN (Recombination protein N)